MTAKIGQARSSPPKSGRRKVGRPPRIDRDKIAQAAHEVGMADLTIKAVADQLGVSVAGLYHHIDGKADLLRLAAEYSATRLPTPVDHDQHWSLWLLEWATYNRNAFMAEPGLLTQYLEGAISAEAIADNADAILGLLVRQGFAILEARAAYELVSSCAIGSAISATRERQAARAGRSVMAEHLRVLAQRDPSDLPYLRLLVAEAATRPDEPFLSRITTVLIGIAIRHGDDWHDVVARIDEALPSSIDD
jgi:AcrR family transcriptional regulator